MVTEEYVDLALQWIQAGKAFLFFGAGFSVGARNGSGASIPMSREFVKALQGFSGRKFDDIKRLWHLSKGAPGFDDFIRTTFTVRSFEPWQKYALSLPWTSAYTTNIDDLVAKVADSLARDRRLPPAIVNGLAERRISDPSIALKCIHIHGCVNDLDSGFVFSEVEYGKITAQTNDWLVNLANDACDYHAIVVGSRLAESDVLDALHRRQGDSRAVSVRGGLIVDPHLTDDDIAYYKEVFNLDGVRVDASTFFDQMSAKYCPPDRLDFLRAAGQIPLGLDDSLPAQWFYGAFEDVAQAASAASKSSRRYREQDFFFGEEPEWWYITHNVPAPLAIGHKIRDAIRSALNNQSPVSIVNVTGASGSGKSTAIRQALTKLERQVRVYRFREETEVNTELLVSLLARGGTWVLYFDTASDFYYLPAELETAMRRAGLQKTNVVFLLESRSSFYSRYRSKQGRVPASDVEVPRLSHADARKLLDRLGRYSALGELAKLDEMKRIEAIIDGQAGAGGDLLVALMEITRGQKLAKIVKDECLGLSQEARSVLIFVCVVGSFGIPAMLRELAHSEPLLAARLPDIVRGELAGMVRQNPGRGTVAARHRRLAEYYVVEVFTASEKKDALVKLLKYLGPSFDKIGVRQHVREYQIFRLLSLHDNIARLLNSEDDLCVEVYHSIREECRWNGLYWLQYGRQLADMEDLDGAMSCFKAGQSAFLQQGSDESFQLVHSMEETRLRLFIRDSDAPVDEYAEAVERLFALARDRPKDVYPLETLTKYLEVLIPDPRVATLVPRDLGRAVGIAKDRMVYDTAGLLHRRVAKLQIFLEK